jgi:peroxisomal membrane protein 4
MSAAGSALTAALTGSNGLSSGILGVLKSGRNGFVYGSRVRFAHSIVMALLFKNGSLMSKFMEAVNLSREHGTLLAKFSIVYKGILLALHNIFRCKQPWHFFVAGAVGGWFVWGSKFDTINSTVALYMFSRAIFGLFAHLHRNHGLTNPFGDKIFAAFCALSWGIGMGMFELNASALNISLVRSQQYIYHQSDHWTTIWDFLPTWKQN